MKAKKVGILAVGAALLLVSLCVCFALANGGIVRVARVAMSEVKGTHRYVSGTTFPSADLVPGVWTAGDGYDLESYDGGLKWVALKQSACMRHGADGARLMTGQRFEVVGPVPEDLQYILQTLPKPTPFATIQDLNRQVAMWNRLCYGATCLVVLLVFTTAGIAWVNKRQNGLERS